MDGWIRYGADLVDELARQDPVFLRMVREHELLVDQFDQLMESLPPDQRDLILAYMNLQLDMESRKTCLAWMHQSENGAA